MKPHTTIVGMENNAATLADKLVVPQGLNIKLSFLCIHARQMKIYVHTVKFRARMFMAILLLIAPNRKNPVCPLTYERGIST